MANAAHSKSTAQFQKNSVYHIPRITKFQDSRTIELFAYIADCRLTEALELLEQSGFSGDTALFVLAYAQSCGGAS